MARPLRIQFEGALYHVTVRGNERKAMVRDDQDRQRFLECLAACVTHFEARLFLFCLLDNHCHLGQQARVRDSKQGQQASSKQGSHLFILLKE